MTVHGAAGHTAEQPAGIVARDGFIGRNRRSKPPRPISIRTWHKGPIGREETK